MSVLSCDIYVFHMSLPPHVGTHVHQVPVHFPATSLPLRYEGEPPAPDYVNITRTAIDATLAQVPGLALCCCDTPCYCFIVRYQGVYLTSWRALARSSVDCRRQLDGANSVGCLFAHFLDAGGGSPDQRAVVPLSLLRCVHASMLWVCCAVRKLLVCPITRQLLFNRHSGVD